MLIPSCFRAYQNVEESYIDHTNFLMATHRYQELFGYDETDYHNWAYGLKRCGYATDPNYAKNLIRIIEQYDLHQFDELPFTFTNSTSPQVHKLVIEEVMEAPTYQIPEQLINSSVASTTVSTPHQENNNTLPTKEQQLFDYQVSSLNKRMIGAVPTAYDTPVDKRERMNPTTTTVMPNRTSGDQHLTNLSRKPRSSSKRVLR